MDDKRFLVWIAIDGLNTEMFDLDHLPDDKEAAELGAKIAKMKTDSETARLAELEQQRVLDKKLELVKDVDLAQLKTMLKG